MKEFGTKSNEKEEYYIQLTKEEFIKTIIKYTIIDIVVFIVSFYILFKILCGSCNRLMSIFDSMPNPF